MLRHARLRVLETPPVRVQGLGFRVPVSERGSQDLGMSLRGFLRGFVVSPRISAMLVGHLTRENDGLRESPQFSAKLPEQMRRKKTEILARGIGIAYLGPGPGGRRRPRARKQQKRMSKMGDGYYILYYIAI